MKDNFLLKKSQQEVFEELSDEDAGKLIKGIFKYVSSGDSKLDGYLKIVFIPIKKEIDKNEERYLSICEKRKEAGRLGGRPTKTEEDSQLNESDEHDDFIDESEEKKANGFSEKQMVSEESKQKQNNPDSDTHNHIHNNHNHDHNSIVSNNNSNLEVIKKIIDYLNLKTKSKFRYSSKTTQQKIIARLNEGYSLDDFIVVINKKTDEWLNDEKFCIYLCPDTLFGTKFEKYLNQKITKKEQKNDKTMNILKGVYNGEIKVN